MNNTFDLRRFGLYARKELSENWKPMALSMVAVTVIICHHIYQEWQSVHDINYKGNYTVKIASSLGVCVILGILLASSFVWKAFSDKKDTFAALTLPVSLPERFLLAWLIAIPIPTIVVSAISQILWRIVTPFFLRDFPDLVIKYSINSLAHGSSSQLDAYGLVLFFGGPALFMLGAVTLGRLNFLKTLGIVIAVSFAFYWAQNNYLHIFFPSAFELQTSPPFPFIAPSIQIQFSKGIFSNTLNSTFENVYRMWWVIGVPLLLHVITYLKIKEKEV